MAKHSKNNIISLSEARHANDNIVDFDEAKSKIIIGKHSKPDVEEQLYDDEPRALPRSNDLVYNAIMSAIVIVLVLILILGGVKILDTYVVEDIQIVGNDIFEYYEVIQYSGIEYRQSMLSVNKEETIKRIESEKPMLQVESVEKAMPNTIIITVSEREPTCYLVLKGSQKCAVIGEGNICLDVVDSYLEEDIPLVLGLEIGDLDKGQVMEDADIRKLNALDTLTEAIVKYECVDRFESINLSNTTNIILKTFDSNTAKIGDTSNIDNKISGVLALLKHYENTLQTEKSIVVTGDNSIYTEQ